MINSHENYFWHRRISQVAVAVSFLVILFYGVSFLNSEQTRLDAAFAVGTLPAALAAVTLVVAMLSLVGILKKLEKYSALFIVGLLLVTTGTLIHTTGGLYSYFLALWVPAVLLLGVFGNGAVATGAAIPILYAAWLYATDIFTVQMGVTTLLIGEIPVFLSALLFSHQEVRKEDSPYKKLANQFSQMSGKSEVVINAITNGVIALDNQGLIELINPEAQRLIGWESRDALKLDYKSVLKLVDEESNELIPANDPIYRALSTNQEVRTEDYKLVTNAGKKILISLVASPVGQMGSGVIIVFRDITKEKAEEREQAEFISTASHEMRTPVASIEGYLGLALNPATAQIDEKARSYILKAHEVAQHLGRLFQDLLDVTKAEDGRLASNPRAVEVVSFVQDVVEGLRPQAQEKGLILIFKPIPDDDVEEKSNRRLNPVFYANVDNDQLREVTANLIENAIKYTKQGTISIDITGDDKQVILSVEDTGIGIPAEDVGHLFQKFYRVDNSDTREIGGTGLGLYLSRRLVEAMEGRIWVESQPSQGSKFFVSIPRISHQEAMELIETMGDEDTGAAIGPAVSSPQIQGVPQFAPPQVQQQPAAPLVGQPVIAPVQSPQPAASPTLSAIEQNPGQYLSSRPRFTVPPRQQGPPSAGPGYNPGNLGNTQGNQNQP